MMRAARWTALGIGSSESSEPGGRIMCRAAPPGSCEVPHERRPCAARLEPHRSRSQGAGRRAGTDRGPFGGHTKHCQRMMNHGVKVMCFQEVNLQWSGALVRFFGGTSWEVKRGGNKVVVCYSRAEWKLEAQCGSCSIFPDDRTNA